MVRSAAVLAAMALAVAGCGGGKSVPASEAAGQAVTGFTKAFSAGDGRKACDLLTNSARAAFIKRVQALAATKDCAVALKKVHDLAGASLTQAFGSATVSDVKVTGATAAAKLTASGHATTVYLAKQGDAWKLTGVPGI